MNTLVEKAKTYRLPNPTTPEDLACNLRHTLRFGDKVITADNYYNGSGNSYIAAIYEFLDDSKTNCDDFIGLAEVSLVKFGDEGHAIAWAISKIKEATND